MIIEDIMIEPHRDMEHTVILTFRGRPFQFNDEHDWLKIASCRGPQFLNCSSIHQAIELVYAICLSPYESTPDTVSYKTGDEEE